MVKITSIDSTHATPQARPEMFHGDVFGQTLIGDDEAPSQRVSAITFQDGARNVWHRHTCEQVLVVIAGEGLVGDSTGEHCIRLGDVVLVQPNERHWHGAAPGQTMTHLSILLPSEMTIDPVQD